MRLNVVFGENVLLVEVVHLFAQVDGVCINIPASAYGHNLLCTVYEGDYDVDARLQRCVILAETLYYLGLRLRDDDKTFLDQHERADYQRDENVNEDVHILRF